MRRIRAVAGPDALVGGSTVFDMNVEHAIFGGIWKMLLFILGASYLVLLLLLRSVLLPLKAVLVNLLSVGAAYGVLVAIFEWGWFDWTGYSSPGYVDTIVPALVLAVTFGLSMDYEVFLLTRIRERWLVHGENERAVSEGLVRSARTITSAAAVMVVVFASFSAAGSPALKELGLGLAVAIFLDATIVRLVVVPAAMRLLGRWNWWFPGRCGVSSPGPRGPALTFPGCGSSSPAARASSARTSSGCCRAGERRRRPRHAHLLGQPREPADGVELQHGDIAEPTTSRRAARDCDAIVNFAAETHVDRST